MTYKTISYGQWGRATEPGSHRKSAVQDQLFHDQMRVIYDRMGMPRKRRPVLIDEDGASFGREWDDLSIASIGLRVAPLAVPYSWPSWTTETEQGREIYQLWSQRLMIRGSEASAFIEWRPAAGLWVDFQGIENVKTEAEVVRLYRAVQRVKAATKRVGNANAGRKTGQLTGGEITEEIKACIVEQVRAWLSDDPQRQWKWILKQIQEKYPYKKYNREKWNESTLRRWIRETNSTINAPEIARGSIDVG